MCIYRYNKNASIYAYISLHYPLEIKKKKKDPD